MKLVVPMGGRGTRLRPLSHTTPKALLPVAGTPAIARTLAAFGRALPRPVLEAVFVLSPEDEHTDVPGRLRAICDGLGLQASFAIQDRPLGTAYAIGSAGDALEGEVLTVWSDTLFEPARRAALEDAPDVVAWTVEVEDPRRFGVVARDERGAVTGLIEKPADARFRETLIGAYYVRDGTALRAAIDRMVASGRTGAGGEYQLTDALDALVQGGAHLQTEPVAEWLDVGTVPAYLHAVAAVLDRERRALEAADPGVGALEGVEIRPPAYVAPDAVVRRSVVGPYASVESGAVLEGAEVRDAVVLSGAEVRESAVTGVVGARARVESWSGPVLLGDDASVGLEVVRRSPLEG